LAQAQRRDLWHGGCRLAGRPSGSWESLTRRRSQRQWNNGKGETNNQSSDRRTDLPASIGPVQLGQLGGWVTVRCPREHVALMVAAGGLWEPGGKRWLIERRRIGPVIRELESTVDPLFRRAQMTWTRSVHWRTMGLGGNQNGGGDDAH
jgi:hypothetical protein